MNETKGIKEFLPLYYGCMVARFDKDGVRYKDCVNTAWIMELFEKNRSEQHFYSYKLLLRPLSDIKIEEAAWCLQQTFFEHVNYPMRDFKLELVGQQGKNPRITISNDWFDETLTFGCDKGSAWSTNNGTRCGVKIKSSIFNYLRKQGIDVDGLIAAGLAIDKTIK